jgi:hypothetical protein
VTPTLQHKQTKNRGHRFQNTLADWTAKSRKSSFQINTDAIELQMNKHKVDQIPAIQIHFTLITKTEPQTKNSLSTFMPPSHGLIHTDKENQTFPCQMPKPADPNPSTKLTQKKSFHQNNVKT